MSVSLSMSGPAGKHRHMVIANRGLAALTLSGNEITDASRALALAGDGLLNDSSYGIWPAATNLITNGGFETNLTGWAPQTPGPNQSVISRITTDYKFGTACQQVVCDGTAAYQGSQISSAVVHPNTYTASIWAKGTVGKPYRFVFYGSVTIATLSGTFTGIWQRLTVTSSTTASGASQVLLDTDSVASAQTFFCDGAQVELGSVATPYIETNGATASRAAARVQAPASVLNATQGWVAMRVRMGFPGTAALGATNPRMLSWGPDSNNILELQRPNDGAVQWSMGRRSANVGASVTVNGPSNAVGDFVTFIGSWTATTVGLSINGAAFTTAANSSIPTITDALFDIGSLTWLAGYTFRGDVLWAALGTGTLTDADATTINGFGSNDRGLDSFPGNPTGFWDAKSGWMETRV